MSLDLKQARYEGNAVERALEEIFNRPAKLCAGWGGSQTPVADTDDPADTLKS